MELVRLRSGRNILIRPIRPDDGPRLSAAYDRLSEKSRYRRFLSSKPYLSARDVRYLVEVDGSSHVALVATGADDRGLLLGVGRFVRLQDDPGAAEFAVVVGDPFQGEGIATELLERLADIATRQGIARFRATVLADNQPAQRLVRRLARRQPRTRRRAGVDEFEIELVA
jgi:RimJ/RimL family protein N-acetyltransferase